MHAVMVFLMRKVRSHEAEFRWTRKISLWERACSRMRYVSNDDGD